jgi:plasmid stabilization system protein ParE
VSRSYRLTPEAGANVDEICAFVAQDSVHAALRVFEALEHAFEQLAATPDIGHKREDLTAKRA